MTVQTPTAVWGPFVGDDIITELPFTSKVFLASHLQVKMVETATEEETILVYGEDADYTITGLRLNNGGAVVLNEPLATGFEATVRRIVPLTQDASLRNQGSFLASTHEDLFDLLVMMILQLKAEFDETILAEAGPQGPEGPEGPQGPAGESDHGALTGLGDDDHPQYQKESEKAQASGYASLDGTTKVPTAQLGGAGADATKYLRGDQSWVAVPNPTSTPVPVRQAADVTVNNSTVLVNTDLTFTGVSGAVYAVAFYLFLNSGATPDSKVGILGTVTTTGKVGIGSGAPLTDFTTPGTKAVDGTGAADFVSGGGVIAIGATGGPVTLKYAQNTGDVSDSKLLSNSVMVVTRIS